MKRIIIVMETASGTASCSRSKEKRQPGVRAHQIQYIRRYILDYISLVAGYPHCSRGPGPWASARNVTAILLVLLT